MRTAVWVKPEKSWHCGKCKFQERKKQHLKRHSKVNTACWKMKMCQWLESVQLKIVLTGDLRHGALSKLPRILLSNRAFGSSDGLKDIKSLSTRISPAEKKIFFREDAGADGTVSALWGGFPHQLQTGIIQCVVKRKTLLPLLFWCAEIRTDLYGVFPWNWATAIFFPKKQETNRWHFPSLP